MASELVFGINMGTKNSYLAVLDKGSQTPKLLTKFPSEVELTNQSDTNQKDCISGFIPLVGRKFDDPIVQKHKEKVPYKIIKGPDGDAWVETNYGYQFSPSELLQKLALKIKSAAETYLGGTSASNSKSVFTFPCRVHAFLSMEMMILGIRAGFHDVMLIHEFSAAAASYLLHKRKGMFAIVDIGARTLDVTFWISPLCDGLGYYTIKGLPQRDLYLGGDDFDSVILKYLGSEFKRMGGIELVIDGRLRKAAEEAKITLSTSIQTEINLPSVTTDPSGDSRDLKIRLTREKFESLAGGLSERIKEHCMKSLNKAGIHAKKLKDVILVGGMANVPMVKRAVQEVFGKAPKRGVVDNDVAVVLGAAIAVQADGNLGINPLCIDI